MFKAKINTLVIIIGQDVCSIIPYIIKKVAPIEFIILKVFTFFIINEMISSKEAMYPTHSVISIPKNILLKFW